MLGMSDVKALLSQTNERTLTLFVNVDNATPENQASVPAWKIWVRDQLESLGKQVASTDSRGWESIRERVTSFVKSYTPSEKTLVIFASEDDITTYELPMRLDENQIALGRPQVGHLLWLIDEYEPYLLVLIDQEKARFFVTYLGSVGFQGGLDSDVEQYDFQERTVMSPLSTGGEGGAVRGGSGVDDHEKMLEEFRSRFYRQVAERVGQLQAKHQTDRIIIGGSEQAAHALKTHLREDIQKHVIGLVSVPLHETPEQILQRVQPMALAFERKQEFELVTQVIDFAKSGGRGALGREAVSEALEMQRIETLILIWPSANEQADNELAFRALQLNSNVELVHGEAAALLHDEGDVAARLYYTL
jgi:hypothetical protein